jgi:predicted PP-loop superfamily ATPase
MSTPFASHFLEPSLTDIEKGGPERAGQRVATSCGGRRIRARIRRRVVDQAQEFEIKIGSTLPDDVTHGRCDFRNDERLFRGDLAEAGLRGV